MNRTLFVSSLALLWFASVAAEYGQAQSSAALPQSQIEQPVGTKIPADPDGTGGSPGVGIGPDNLFSQQKLVNFLQVEITTESLQGSPRLDEFLEQLHITVEKQHKLPLPLFVDTKAFKSENPEAPPVYDDYIAMPSFPKKMAIVTVLRLAMVQIRTQNATFLIRRGQVVITTQSAAQTSRLLQENVTAAFVNAPLADALAAIAFQTGLSITLDQAALDKANMKLPTVSATFPNNVSAESALATLAELAGLKMIVLGDVVYITTVDRAGDLFLLERDLKNRPNYPVMKYVGSGG
jgi:hypothetical protein